MIEVDKDSINLKQNFLKVSYSHPHPLALILLPLFIAANLKKKKIVRPLEEFNVRHAIEYSKNFTYSYQLDRRTLYVNI